MRNKKEKEKEEGTLGADIGILDYWPEIRN